MRIGESNLLREVCPSLVSCFSEEEVVGFDKHAPKIAEFLYDEVISEGSEAFGEPRVRS